MLYFGNSFIRFVRKIGVLALMLTLVIPLYAGDETTAGESIALDENGSYTGLETVEVDLSSLPVDESSHYAFLYGYQAMLQKKCRGALLTFDENMEYITGFLTADAPDDFCTRISPTTIAVAEPVLSEVMSYMYTLLGDRSSISILMGREDKAYNAIILFEPEEDVVLTPMWYSDAENLIKENAVASGINPDEVYQYLAEDGMDKDTIIALVASDKSKALELVLSAVKLRNEAKKNASRGLLAAFGITDKTLYTAIAGLVAVGAVVLIIYVLTRIFVHKPGNSDDNEEIEQEKNND